MNALHTKSRSKRQEIRLKLLNEHKRECFYCHRPLRLDTMTLDHRIPRTEIKGQEPGTNGLQDNLVPACRRCNHRKGSMTEQEFRRMLGNALYRQ